MENITRTPSSSRTDEFPREMDKKNVMETLETAPAEDLIEDLHSIASELLGEFSDPEPSPLTTPSTPKEAMKESNEKESQSSKVALENNLEKQSSRDSLDSFYVWNTGYFSDLTAGSGDIWKDRSVRPSRPNIFKIRKKNQADTYHMENKEGGHNCGVLFWGW